MFEFTLAFLKPFSWLKRTYEYGLARSNNDPVVLDETTLTEPIANSMYPTTGTISKTLEWNTATYDNLINLGALYGTTDQLEAYFNSLYTIIQSRFKESEGRLQEQESSLQSLMASSKRSASTSIQLKGGSLVGVEQADKFYRDFGLLTAVPEEGIFRLKDTGFFSSIRSLGGFAGTIKLDYILGEMVEQGELTNIIDNTRNTFWMGTYYSAAPMKGDTNIITWLPEEYKHGFAVMMTMYLDRPTLATEIFIDPVTTEPMDLVSISWTPIGIENILVNSTFSASSGWSYTTATYQSSGGVDNGGCVTVSTSGYAKQTFSLAGNYLASGSTELVTTGARCQVNYSMTGSGDVAGGARISWLNNSGKVVGYKTQEDYPTGFFSTYGFLDLVPSGAVSGVIEVGIFNPASGAVFFDNVNVIIGEKTFQVGELIDRPKTISLPEVARSGRFSLVFAQRNPRREILARNNSQLSFNFGNSRDIDPSLIEIARNLTQKTAATGPGTTLFAYRLGFKEIDFRYREHIPRGSLVSLPIVTSREIRDIWLSTEVGQYFNDSTRFYLYPFADDPKNKIQVNPFVVGTVDNATSQTISDGDILKIYTKEEQDDGWINTNDNTFIVSPKTMTETFDGTNRDAKIKLSNAIHTRRVKINSIGDWINKYTLLPGKYDPNLEVIYGLPLSASNIVDAIRTGVSSSFETSDLINYEGYIPLKVTILTEKFTAYPDIYGKPDSTKIRTVLGEILTQTTVVETTVEESLNYISFEAWLATTKGKDLDHHTFMYKTFPTQRDMYLKDIINLTKNDQYHALMTQRYKSIYESLKSQSKLPKENAPVTTRTSAIDVNDAFSTRFKPIIIGSRGSLIRLYWYNPTDQQLLIIPQTQYEVTNPNIGLVKILAEPPSSGYTDIAADYKYLNTSATEDHFNSIINFSSNAGSSLDGSMVITKPLPITRNMTDYNTGKVPTLKAPNFDRLDKNYYPVIEYYVNSDGELVFSRDFFKYGDIPARILVQYQTLGIQPRLGVEVTRSGSPAATPTLYNIGLRVRETAASLLRES